MRFLVSTISPVKLFFLDILFCCRERLSGVSRNYLSTIWLRELRILFYLHILVVHVVSQEQKFCYITGNKRNHCLCCQVIVSPITTNLSSEIPAILLAFSSHALLSICCGWVMFEITNYNVLSTTCALYLHIRRNYNR